jgi:ribose/xylose/arabinose/galactoside ABC-type transport system permease subunit
MNPATQSIRKVNPVPTYINVERIKSAGHYAKLMIWLVLLQTILGGVFGFFINQMTSGLFILLCIPQIIITISMIYSFNGIANELIRVDVDSSKEDKESLAKMLDKGLITQDEFDSYNR